VSLFARTARSLDVDLDCLPGLEDSLRVVQRGFAVLSGTIPGTETL
jgi:hypothetical protein